MEHCRTGICGAGIWSTQNSHWFNFSFCSWWIWWRWCSLYNLDNGDHRCWLRHLLSHQHPGGLCPMHLLQQKKIQSILQIRFWSCSLFFKAFGSYPQHGQSGFSRINLSSPASIESKKFQYCRLLQRIWTSMEINEDNLERLKNSPPKDQNSYQSTKISIAEIQILP